jgi:D-tyrosyl-tRNA(Tyr) deacylase
MRALLQRVSRASVTVGGETVGAIGPGLAILLGVTHGDTATDADALADQCVGLRIFADADGKMNRSLRDIAGEALVVSQFTLYGDARRGRRPSYTEAARPEHANPLYERFLAALREAGIPVAAGRFGAAMQVEIHNDGPVTLMLETGRPEPAPSKG